MILAQENPCLQTTGDESARIASITPNNFVYLNMLTYEYKLYSSKRNRKIDAMLREACFVWNHALALQKRYYSLTGKYCSCARMKAHFARRITRHLLHSQTVQEILERLDESFRRFFNHLAARPPKLKKAEQFQSIVWKQGGFKLNANVFVVNSIKQHFKFSYSRPYEGRVRQVRIKRSHLGEYYLYIVTDAVAQPCRKSHNGASVGLDFGLKHYQTADDGTRINSPLFLRQGMKDLKKASRHLSKCEKGSSHRKAARLNLDRIHEKIAHRRDDWQWNLCHGLCRKYDVICIEDLQLTGMSRLWGRKMSDLAFGSFVQKLEHTASKYGCRVVKIDRYYPSSKTCNVCQYVNELLSLSDRSWTCPSCGTSHERDVNAAKNILRQGIASSGSPCKTRLAEQGASATGESPLL